MPITYLRFTVLWLSLAVLAGTGRAQFVIDSLHIDGSQVVAFDPDGNQLWSYTAPGPVSTTELGDVNGDTYNEVMVGTTSAAYGKVIYLLNNGSESWRYQTGTTGVYWADSLYTVMQLDICDVDGDGQQEIISSSNHAILYPSRLCVLSNSGALQGDYWNPGHTGFSPQSMFEADLDANGIREIVVDCINNDLGYIHAVFLLEGDSVHGQAPPYFGNGDHGNERWYFTEHNSEVLQFAVAEDIDADGWNDLRIVYEDGRELYLSGSTGEVVHPELIPPFVDCFDNASLSNWTTWGDPLPLWRDLARGRQGVFDNNGDATGNSGAVSNAVCDISHGFVLQAEVMVDHIHWGGCWNRAAIGLANPVANEMGEYEPYIYIDYLKGGDCPGIPADGHILCYYLSSDGPWADTLWGYGNVGSWTKLTINVDSSTNLPRFYAAGNLIFTPSVPIADSVLATRCPIWLGAQSSGLGGKAYHDWVSFNVGSPARILEVTRPGWDLGWRIGQEDAAEWWVHNLGGNIAIDLYNNGSFVQNIVASWYIGAYQYPWTVPNTVAAGDGYQVLIRSLADTSVHHLGAPFTILAPVVFPGGFSDNFSTSDFDQWTLWGDPLPGWEPGAQYRTGLFDNHGDANFESGATSDARLDYSGGFSIQSDMLVDFYNPPGCWLSASFGIADTVLDVSWGGYNRILEFGLASVGDGCFSVPEQYRHHSWFQGSYQTAQGVEYVGGENWADWISGDAYANSWHTFRVVVDSVTWVPRFYAADSLIYTGSSPLAPSVRNIPRPLSVHGHSFGWAGRAYHDYVEMFSHRPTALTPRDAPLNRSFRLGQNYPNPFNQSTAMQYELGTPANVRLAVYDLLGQEVAILFDGVRPAGAFTAEWNGKTKSGVTAASGVYLCGLQADANRAFRKMLLVR